MRRCLLLLSVALATSPTLSGCSSDGPLGGLGTTLSNSLRSVLPEDLANSWLGPREGSQEDELAQLRLKARRRKAAARAAAQKAQPARTGLDEVAVEKQARQNMLFDHYRTEGIDSLEAGHTADAIASFKKALQIRPGDTNATMWLDVAEHPERHTPPPTMEEGLPNETMPPGAPQAVPVLPGGLGQQGGPPPLPLPPG